VRKTIRKILAAVILTASISALSFAADTGAILNAIEKTNDPAERARLYKDLGDRYASEEDYRSAADAYIEALDEDRNSFSPADRTVMAVSLLRAERLKEARFELRHVLKQDPENAEARINLARVLSWSGKNREAIQEADRVLAGDPENRSALFVKANALRLQGDVTKAVPIYTRLLTEEEEFDSRLGLTYSYLANGEIERARKSYSMLKPRFSYQERDLEKASYTMNRESRPKLDGGYSYYNDTDENVVHRMGISQGYWSGRWKSSVHFRHTAAKDPAGKNRASDVWARSYGKVNDWFRAGGGLGLTQFANGKKREIVTGHIRGDLRFLDGNIGAGLSVKTLSDTARLIDNRIYFTDAGISFSQDLTPRFGFSLRYHYRDYSDENSSSLLQFNTKYLICRGKPEIIAGVRPRYVNFNRQSGGGYFDPRDFLSLQAFVSLFVETRKYFLYLEPFIGVQSFTRSGEETDDTFGGGYGSLGWNITPDFSLELNGEGGNFALATPAGSEYYRVGVNVNVYF
jgi:thioredoxin-like negative regulator of GroEL